MEHPALAAVLDRLAGLPDLEKNRSGFHRLGLEPILASLCALGRPDRAFRTVLVAGSKGKGTTVLLLEALLCRAGRRTGAFLSPHLSHLGERFLLAGRPASLSDLAQALSEAADHLPGTASFFDALTAGALVLFRRQGVQDALLEVGLGGRLDSTNAVEPALTVITSLEREHEDILGPGLARIAREKAGILRPGVPLITACRGRALTLLGLEAVARPAPLLALGRDFFLRPLSRSPEGWRVELTLAGGLPLVVDTRLKATAHLASLALAAQAFALLQGPPDAPLLSAAAATPLPGRFEVFPGRPDWLVDGAHTGRSLVRLAQDLRIWFPGRPFHLLFGVARDKRWQRAFGLLARLATRVWAVTLPGSRGVPAAELAATLPEKVLACPDLDEAYCRLIQAAAEGDLAVATGSFQVAGWLCKRLRGGGEAEDA